MIRPRAGRRDCVMIRYTLNEPPVRDAAVVVLGDPEFHEHFGFRPVETARCPYDEGNRCSRALRWEGAPERFEIEYIDAFTIAEINNPSQA